MFGGKPATPLVAPVVAVGKLMQGGRKVGIVGTEDPVNWRKNAAGGMEIGYDGNEQAVRFAVKFPPNVDRWVYPEYVLQLPQESLKGAAGISFEIRTDVPADKISKCYLMAVMGKEKEQGSSVDLPYDKPSAKWESGPSASRTRSTGRYRTAADRHESAGGPPRLLDSERENRLRPVTVSPSFAGGTASAVPPVFSFMRGKVLFAGAQAGQNRALLVLRPFLRRRVDRNSRW